MPRPRFVRAERPRVGVDRARTLLLARPLRSRPWPAAATPAAAISSSTRASRAASPGATASAASTSPLARSSSSSSVAVSTARRILEVGGGIGEIQLELLKRGAQRTINLELSPAYEEEAARLIREAGLEGRVERRRHDIAVDPAGVEPVDIVLLNRVVCCYPDYERLLGAAADHATRALVFSHPPRNLMWRAIVATQNLGFRLLGREFRTFAHPPAAMLAVAEERGLRRSLVSRGFRWRVAGLER